MGNLGVRAFHGWATWIRITGPMPASSSRRTEVRGLLLEARLSRQNTIRGKMSSLDASWHSFIATSACPNQCRTFTLTTGPRRNECDQSYKRIWRHRLCVRLAFLRCGAFTMQFCLYRTLSKKTLRDPEPLISQVRELCQARRFDAAVSVCQSPIYWHKALAQLMAVAPSKPR